MEEERQIPAPKSDGTKPIGFQPLVLILQTINVDPLVPADAKQTQFRGGRCGYLAGRWSPERPAGYSVGDEPAAQLVGSAGIRWPCPRSRPEGSRELRARGPEKQVEPKKGAERSQFGSATKLWLAGDSGRIEGNRVSRTKPISRRSGRECGRTPGPTKRSTLGEGPGVRSAVWGINAGA